jgi:hypothetical protein
MLKYAWRVAPAAVQLVQPVHQRGHELVSHLDIVATTARRNAKRVIRLRHYHEACVCAELRNDTSQTRHVSECVTITLQEQHWHVHAGQVLGARDARLTGGVQRKAEEDHATHTRQRQFGLRLRRHAAPERFATGKQH